MAGPCLLALTGGVLQSDAHVPSGASAGTSLYQMRLQRQHYDRFFRSACLQLLAYGTFSYMAYKAARDEPWFRDTSYFWRGYPNHQLT